MFHRIHTHISRPWFEGQCAYCSRGRMCPGDDETYPCEGNTYAPDYGMTKCENCPQDLPFASYSHIFCMPPDTPKDTYQFRLSHDVADEIQIPYAVTHCAVEIDYDLHEGTQLMTMTFSNYSRNALPMTLYASTKTGNPNENNYEFKAHGQNVTIAFEKPSEGSILPVYLTLETGVPKVRVNEVGISSPKNLIQIKPPGTEFILDKMIEPYLFFEVSNIDVRSRVNITMSGQPATPSTETLSFYMYYSRSTKYPTQYNYDQNAWHGGKGSGIATMIIDSVEPGLLYFGVSPFILVDNVRVKVSVTVTPL
jgi:hypothetical protein